MKRTISVFVIAIFSIAFFNATAQELKLNKVEESELNKTSLKGRYAGTILNGQAFKVLFITNSKTEGVQLDQYDFDGGLKPLTFTDLFVSSIDASKQFAWYMPKDKVEKISPSSTKFIQATAAFGGGMKMYLGSMEKNIT